MEQQQSQEKARREPERRERTEETRQAPERARLAGAGYTLRGVLAGENLYDLPPARLEELAMWLGNQNMAALLERQARPPGLTEFVPPEGEPDTAPVPVSGEARVLPGPPQNLTVAEVTVRAFDPAVTAEGGGASRGL